MDRAHAVSTSVTGDACCVVYHNVPLCTVPRASAVGTWREGEGRDGGGGGVSSLMIMISLPSALAGRSLKLLISRPLADSELEDLRPTCGGHKHGPYSVVQHV